MQYSQLVTVRHRIQLGMPLPFNIRDADETLLLARGQVIESDEQLENLLDRGALVDEAAAAAQAASLEAEVASATPQQLPGLWGKSIERMGQALRQSQAANPAEFGTALSDASKPVVALIERDPDLAIFQVVRQEAKGQNAYAVQHSVHAAIACYLVATRLGWNPAQVERSFKAALTMNIAMLDLQNKLAAQTTALTPLQREAIFHHPTRSVAMLRASGVGDEEWLDAVLNHHETDDQTGYPRRPPAVSELAALLRRVDIYTAKLSPRAGRIPLPANRAGRELFMQDGGHAMSAAIVKEFGVYPPGCYVALASGETGVTVGRGSAANNPIVAALTNRKGEALMEPVRRDTAQKDFTIVAVIPESSVKVRVAPEKLVVLALG